MITDYFQDLVDDMGAVGYILIAFASACFLICSPFMLIGYLCKFIFDILIKKDAGSVTITYLEPKAAQLTREQIKEANYVAHLLFLLSEGDLTKDGQKRLYEKLKFKEAGML